MHLFTYICIDIHMSYCYCCCYHIKSTNAYTNDLKKLRTNATTITILLIVVNIVHPEPQSHETDSELGKARTAAKILAVPQTKDNNGTKKELSCQYNYKKTHDNAVHKTY